MTLRREDRDGGVVVLTVDRPEARNALSPEIRSGFGEQFETMREDETVRAVVVTGAGGHFCAGGDVKTMGSREVMAGALERAGSLAASALGGYAALKAMMEDREALRAALEAEARTQIERSRTWEHQEGVAAFREKRPPDYVRRSAADAA